MIRCSACSREIPQDSRVCPYCGEAVEAEPGLPTVTAPPKAAVRAAHPAPSGSSSDSIDQARFTPGTLLTERYRIVGLLGKGGMGEVYRADDLKLRQPVALKFLPAELSKDQRRLERFHHEVRVARQVSHPNVCRVYDIGEADGQHFISMEYVDGEDLASVLRRMGRPSKDKAIQIARQLCAGLAAAHDKGVLHRDLKPHNVMIDGRGKVRITDFGLAGFVEDFAGREVAAGTPAYMAPEQLAGREVSVKSDIYSLGLVLFELFAGRRLFEGATREQIERARTTTTPTTLSGYTDELDPAIERLILRCLEPEPAARPSSVLAVAAALPGGDPLAAALAAGETPDPSMVAAAGGVGGLEPRVAVPLLVGALVGVLACVLLSQQTDLINRAPMVHPPEVLAAKARELLARVGHGDAPLDSAYGFTGDRKRQEHTRRHDKSPDRWDRFADGRPSPIHFWYRESPVYLARTQFLTSGGVSLTDPSADTPDMASVVLEPDGRLLRLTVVPPRLEEPLDHPTEPDWAPLLDQAGLDSGQLTPVPSTWVPPVWADRRAAWTGHYPNRPDLPVSIEAAAYRGKPVYFEVIFPWTRPDGGQVVERTTGQTIGTGIIVAVFLTIVVGSVLVAARNLRLGRGDRRGAMRLALFVVAAVLISWLFSRNHVPTFYELGLFVNTASWALFGAALVWLSYMALEPYVRRRWPHALISWTRLLSGRIRDPLVGRDVLVGGVLGAAMALIWTLYYWVPSRLGLTTPAPELDATYSYLLGARSLVSGFLYEVPFAMFLALGTFFLLFVLRVIVRNIWVAGAVLVVMLVGNLMLQTDTPAITAVGVFLFFSLWIVVLVRFGLLTLLVALVVDQRLEWRELTYSLDAWYAGASMFAVLVVAAIVLYGFFVALAGRSLFKDELLET